MLIRNYLFCCPIIFWPLIHFGNVSIGILVTKSFVDVKIDRDYKIRFGEKDAPRDGLCHVYLYNCSEKPIGHCIVSYQSNERPIPSFMTCKKLAGPFLQNKEELFHENWQGGLFINEITIISGNMEKVYSLNLKVAAGSKKTIEIGKNGKIRIIKE